MARITRMSKLRLGELLQAAGLVTEEQVRNGLEEQRKSNLFLGEALVKLGYVSEEAIALAIVQQFSLPFISATQFNITPEIFNLFPERMYYEYQFIAVDKIGNVIIIVAAGLMNHDVLGELERLTACRVCQFVSTWKDIRAVVQRLSQENEKRAELTSLGTMLLDSGEFPRPSAIITATPDGVAAPAAAGNSAVSRAVSRSSDSNPATTNLKPLGSISAVFLSAVNQSGKGKPGASGSNAAPTAAIKSPSATSLSAFKGLNRPPAGTAGPGTPTSTVQPPRLTAFGKQPGGGDPPSSDTTKKIPPKK